MCDFCSEQVAKLKRLVALTLFEMLIGGDNACLASWMHHMQVKLKTFDLFGSHWQVMRIYRNDKQELRLMHLLQASDVSV